MTLPHRVLLAVVVVAVLGAGWLAISMIGGGGSTTASPTAAIVSSAPGSGSAQASASPSPTQAPSTPPSPSATASPTAKPTATPKPTTPSAPPATIVITQLMLDAQLDPDGKDRIVSFRAGGGGEVTIDLAVTSPQGSAEMCLREGDNEVGCTNGADGRLSAKTTTKEADFVVTLRGEGIETPLVDVTLTFPATAPSIAIANARFDGMDYPVTNGLQAVVTPRTDGGVTLDADWGGHPFLYQISLVEQGGPGRHVLTDQGPATRVSETLPVTAPNPWRLVLENSEGGFGVTVLDAVIAWP